MRVARGAAHRRAECRPVIRETQTPGVIVCSPCRVRRCGALSVSLLSFIYIMSCCLRCAISLVWTASTGIQSWLLYPILLAKAVARLYSLTTTKARCGWHTQTTTHSLFLDCHPTHMAVTRRPSLYSIVTVPSAAHPLLALPPAWRSRPVSPPHPPTPTISALMPPALC